MGIIRKTKSVKMILGEFNSDSVAISATMLTQRLQKEFNKTTIYRVLDKLEDDGVVHSFMGKDGIKWYAKCTTCTSHHHVDIHPHFQCVDCGKVDCLSIPVKLPKVENRKIISSSIFIEGRCESCI